VSFVERFVDAAANGSGNGTTAATSGAAGAWTWAQMVAGFAAGQRLNVKAGTYARTTAADSLAAAAGSQTAGIWFRGYNTTPGDIDADQTLAKPLVTYTTGGLTFAAGFTLCSNLSLQGATVGNLVVASTNGPALFDRCRFENTAANAAAAAFGCTARAACSRCWFKATATATNVVAPSGATGDLALDSCVVTGGGNGVLLAAAAHLLVHGCVVYSVGGDGVRVAASPTLLSVAGCTFYGCGSDGVEMTGPGSSPIVIRDNVFANGGGYGVNNSSGANVFAVHRHNNDFYSNTSGKENGFGDSPSLSEQVETASPFVSVPSDLRLLAAALAKATGSPYPGPLENLTYSGYLDVGAVQRQEGPAMIVLPRRGGVLLKM
jgi:hypothetical protein